MNYNDHKYDDIINLSHHTSTKHPRMPLADRAAQFAPFAALSGHDDAIKETARLTDERLVLSEDALAILDEKMSIIAENLGTDMQVDITYFVPDERKDGGSYVSHSGVVKKIDMYEHTLTMTDGFIIPMWQIFHISSDVYEEF